MITCISPDEEDAGETRNVLNYASRAMKIKNKPKPHRFELKDDSALLMHLQHRMAELEQQLAVSSSLTDCASAWLTDNVMFVLDLRTSVGV